MPSIRPRRSLACLAGAALILTRLMPSLAAAQPEDTPGHAPEHHLRHRHPDPARPPHARPAAHVHPSLPAHHPAPRPPPPPVPPPPVAPPVLARGTNTGLPLPRFAALRADAVNLRSGPGTRYPIQWVYKRRDLPVRIEREFDVWRLVEDADGVKGWVQGATLVGTRSFVILPAGGVAPPAAPDTTIQPGPAPDAPPGSQFLRSAPQPDASVVAILKPGVIGRLRLCAAGSDWCRVAVRDYAGWLPRAAFWGLLPDETIQPP